LVHSGKIQISDVGKLLSSTVPTVTYMPLVPTTGTFAFANRPLTKGGSPMDYELANQQSIIREVPLKFPDRTRTGAWCLVLKIPDNLSPGHIHPAVIAGKLPT